MFEKLLSIFSNPATTEAVTETAEALETAQQVAETAVAEITPLTVFGFGFGLVFIGLISIIIICKIMGAICQLFIKEDKAPKEKKVKASKQEAPAKFEIPNKGEFVAAVSAALAEEMGKDVSAIRILSIKKL